MYLISDMDVITFIYYTTYQSSILNRSMVRIVSDCVHLTMIIAPVDVSFESNRRNSSFNLFDASVCVNMFDILDDEYIIVKHYFY
jgi:hypothetical protein